MTHALTFNHKKAVSRVTPRLDHRDGSHDISRPKTKSPSRTRSEKSTPARRTSPPGPPRDGAPLERASADEGGRARERGEAVGEVEHFWSRQSDAGHPTRCERITTRTRWTRGYAAARHGYASTRIVSDARYRRRSTATRSDEEGRPRARDASVTRSRSDARGQRRAVSVNGN